MVTVVGVRLALQQRQFLLRQLAEGLTARKRLEEAQHTLLERIKRGEQLNQELTQKVAHLQQSERELNNAHSALVTQAREDAAALARASVALQTESVARIHLEQELHLTTRAAADANRVKSEFLANINHELRTPLNGVIGMTKLLLDTNLTLEQRDYANSVGLSADLLHTVTNNLFDFSELEAGNLTLEASDFELPQIIDGITNLFADTARQKQLELSSFIHDDVPTGFNGDATRLRQVLLSLIGNAVKFTETGSVSIQTNLLHQTSTTATLRFSIHDTGIGIPLDRQSNLFQPFFQVDASSTRRYGGSGIGLALGKKLVELMGGVIGAESTLGKGSLFWFTLPLRKQRLATTTPAFRPKQPVAVSDRPEAKPRILVAEDNLVNQKLVSRVLEKLGYDVRLVFNGQEAVYAIEQGAYAAVLMDCQMPVMDGLTATETIRAWESAQHLRRTPIIALTAHMVAGDRERCLAVGMDDYLSKPLKLDKLAPTLKHWLEQLPPPEEAFLWVSPLKEKSHASAVASSKPAVTENMPHQEKRGQSLSPASLDDPNAPCLSSDLSPAVPSFDLSEALERVDGDRELLSELAGLFLDSCPTYLANIQQALQQGDAQALAFSAHALKGSIGNFIKIGPFETARALESLGRQGTLTGASALFQKLENEMAHFHPILANLQLEVAA
jgi:signal transduction histidine kinase/CheY-like chemotaxis protein